MARPGRVERSPSPTISVNLCAGGHRMSTGPIPTVSVKGGAWFSAVVTNYQCAHLIHPSTRLRSCTATTPSKKPRPCSRRTENIAHSRYSGQNSKCAAGSRAPLCPFGRGKRVKTVRLNHLRAALLTAAAAGLLAAVGLVVVLYAQPAEAKFPGKPGKIAYQGYDGNDSEIYTIKPGGGGKVKLTDNATDDSEPSYSPSGKKIVYSGEDGPNADFEIYTINAGGGGKFKVTDNSTEEYYSSYSPNGKRIAYSGEEGPNADWEIYTIKPGGGGKFNVTDNSTDDVGGLSYSPSGKKIAYSGKDAPNGDYEIYTINPGGGGKFKVTDNTTADLTPSW